MHLQPTPTLESTKEHDVLRAREESLTRLLFCYIRETREIATLRFKRLSFPTGYASIERGWMGTIMYDTTVFSSKTLELNVRDNRASVSPAKVDKWKHLWV